MADGSYKQFCRSRWPPRSSARAGPIVLLRELVAGSTRFNELRRGVPRMSPALLSQAAEGPRGGRHRRRAPGRPASRASSNTADCGRPGARPIVEAIGVWGQRWVETESSLGNLDRQSADVGHAAQIEHRRRCRGGAA